MQGIIHIPFGHDASNLRILQKPSLSPSTSVVFWYSESANVITNEPEVSRSLQSWVPTVQSVELTDDVFAVLKAYNGTVFSYGEVRLGAVLPAEPHRTPPYDVSFNIITAPNRVLIFIYLVIRRDCDRDHICFAIR